MTDPDVMLLDEPFAGVNPTLEDKLLDRIHELREEGLTFLLVEHDMDLIMEHCEHIIVMHQGRVLDEGSPERIRNNEEVIEAYLGVRYEPAGLPRGAAPGQRGRPPRGAEPRRGLRRPAGAVERRPRRPRRRVRHHRRAERRREVHRHEVRLRADDVHGRLRHLRRHGDSEPRTGEHHPRGHRLRPQNENVFAGLSVEENLEMGAYILDEVPRAASRRCTTGSPSSKSAPTRRRGRSPAASSRCSRWGAR